MPHGKSRSLTVATYNIHKGFSHFNQRIVVHDMRDRLRMMGADVLFLQEVVGHNSKHVENHEMWPDAPQHEFLAEKQWPAAAYAKNAIYVDGHHGNAILSRFPILHAHNQDVTHLQFERRGLLHCQIRLPEGQAAHCVCAHLSLFGYSRRKQMDALANYLEKQADPATPLIIAGDFNDWRNRAGEHLAHRLGLREVFCGPTGAPARSFPAAMPMFRLDRIYVRGFDIRRTEVHHGQPWSAISDHAALSAHLARHGR